MPDRGARWMRHPSGSSKQAAVEHSDQSASMTSARELKNVV